MSYFSFVCDVVVEVITVVVIGMSWIVAVVAD
jgi:hypothetical protein